VSAPTFDAAMLNWGRLILDGLPFADVREAETREAGETWLDFWTAKADQYESMAEQALAAGHTVSGGEWLWLASLCCQYAQFLWFDERRKGVQRRKASLYARAAPHLRPPARPFSVSVGLVDVPCFLRLPEHAADEPVACAILLGGLESTKEESYAFENLLLDRGIATCTFDGPGQGELLEKVALSPDFERYTSAVLDRLIENDAIDPARVGVVGRSLGGCYALRSASTDERLKACISWGGFVTVDWNAEPAHDRASWRYVSKVTTDEEARARVEKSLDTRPVLGQLRCPTYFLHGALDEVPLGQIDVLREFAVNADLTVIVEPHGDHCCHNLGPAPRLRMADWLAERLS